MEQIQEDLQNQLNNIPKTELLKPSVKPIGIPVQESHSTQIINQEADFTQINKKLAELSESVEGFKKHDDEINRHSFKLEDHDSRFKYYENEINQINEKLDTLETRLKLCEDGLLKKADMDEIQSLLSHVSTGDIKTIIQTSSPNYDGQTKELETRLYKAESIIETLLHSLKNRASLSDISRINLDINAINESLKNKTDLRDALKIQGVIGNLITKINYKRIWKIFIKDKVILRY